MAYTDAFTGTSGTNLETYNATWVNIDGGAGSFKIQSNQAQAQVLSDSQGYLYNQTFASKHYAQAKVVDVAGAGPGIRMATGPNYYYCSPFAGDKVYNGEVVAGSATDWDAGLTVPAANTVCRLEVDSTTETTIIYKEGGVTKQTYTSKSSLSGGRAGLCAYSSGGLLDNWEGGDTAAAGISASLSGTGTLTVAQPVANTTVQGSLTGAGALAATLTAHTAIAANLSGAGTLTAAQPTGGSLIDAALTGTGTMTVAQPSTSVVIGASLTGVGSMTVAEPALAVDIAATLTGAGALSATLDVRTSIAANLTGAGALAADVTVGTAIAASMTGAGALSADVTVSAAAGITANLTGTGVLTASVDASTTIAANLTGAGDLAASLGAVDTAIAADLSGAGALSAAVAVTTTTVAVPVVHVGGMPSPARYLRELPTNMLPVEVLIRLEAYAAIPTIVLQPGAVAWNGAIRGQLGANENALTAAVRLPAGWEIRAGNAIGPGLANVGKTVETRDRRVEVWLTHQRDQAVANLVVAQVRHEDEMILALSGAFEIQSDAA